MEAKEWKVIEWQELFIACAMEGRGYLETGAYENALSSFTEAVDVIERFMIKGKSGFAAYPIAGTHSNHAAWLLAIAGCKLKLHQTDDIDDLIERAKIIYFKAYEDIELYDTEKTKKEQNENFTKWYQDAGLSEFKPLELVM